ncbi:hypothetical protein MNBD_UNCLBAC01-1930 [hydrothermal vent metagenome]|uniref:DUF4258 domain-containing protein n=1 Tax=hydrothermal vent metagenome TaxID=652676 RepID=A0A3B1DHR8_9ZZZZ
MKQIEWQVHARQRLVERGINIHLIRKALLAPDQVIFHRRQKIIHKRYYDMKREKEYLLRLFIEETSEKWIINSVYRTSKISKYWRVDL